MGLFKRVWAAIVQPAPVAAPVVAIPLVPAPAPPPMPPAAKVRMTADHVAWSKRKVTDARPATQVFTATAPAPGVLPKGKTIAMDSAVNEFGAWANNALGSMVLEGQTFLGYPYLAELAQRPEYRRPTEIIAQEMTREWIRMATVGDEDKSEKIKEIEADLKEFGVRDLFREMAEHDGFFGRGHIYIDTGATDDPEELLTSIGDGRDATSQTKLEKGCLKRLKTVEPMWTYPAGYNSNDPLSPEWYRPGSWYVMAKEVHASRLLTIVGREVPDLLKPAYMFGGLSMSQMAKPYVDNWLRTRQDVSDAVHRFSTTVLKTDLSVETTGEDLENRVQTYTNYANNNGVMLINMETEDFANVSMPLTSLDLLQAQAQEHQASVFGIPLVKLLGIQPAGLNASSDGEIRVFEDGISAYQEALYRKPLQKVIDIIQINRYGVVDPDITFAFEPLWSLDEEKRAAVRKIEAETDVILIDGGIISTEEARARVAGDVDTPYHGLDVSELPEPPDDGSDLTGEEDGEPSSQDDGETGEDTMENAKAMDRLFEARES
jgi:hypothetical protein